MKKWYKSAARKRPVNLTLNEDLAEQAKRMTIESTVAAWNDFNTQTGSFSDEYSSP